MTPLPDGQWKEVAVDFTGPFAGGEYLLVVIDEYSRFPEVQIDYSVTPHSSTGLSPAEMLIGRKLGTGVPNVSKKKTVTFQDRMDLASCKDKRVKAYIKDLADHRRKAKDTDIAIGDSVLIKQPKQNKLSTPFKPVPYKVIEKKGSMITAQHGSHIMTRNSLLMKKVSSDCGKGKVIEEDPIVNKKGCHLVSVTCKINK